MVAVGCKVVEERGNLLTLLGQPVCLKIIDLLRHGERCVCEIPPAIGEEPAMTSLHLNRMIGAGVLTRNRVGDRILYAVKHPEVLALVDLADLLSQLEENEANLQENQPKKRIRRRRKAA